MPTWAEAIQTQIQADNGFLVIAAACVYITLHTRHLWIKYGSFQRLTKRLLWPLLGLETIFRRLALQFTTLPQNRVLWAILALALVLRAPLLADSFWFDEAVTNRIIHLPFANLPAATLADNHPPLHYLLMWPIAQFTDNPALLRLPSLAAGMLAVWLMWRLMRDLLFIKTACYWGALLVAILPASIYYAGELRAYQMLVVIVLGMFVSMLENRPRLFAVLLAAAGWSHNIGFIYAGVAGIAALVYWRGRSWLLAVGVGWLIGALWLPFLLQQSSHISDGYWSYISPGAVLWPLVYMTIGWLSFAGGMLVPFVFSAAALADLRRWLASKNGLAWLALVFGVPLLAAGISFGWHSIYVYRAFLPSMILLVVAWAELLDRSKIARLIFVTFLLLALGDFYTYSNPAARLDYRGAIASICKESDVAFATSINAAFLLSENSKLPVIVWDQAVDIGGVFRLENLPAYGYAVGNIPSSGACLFQIDNPASTPEERGLIEYLLYTHPHKTHVLEAKRWQTYSVHALK